MLNKTFAPRNKNTFLTLNYTGQYNLPTSTHLETEDEDLHVWSHLELLATIETEDGDLHVWSASLDTDWAKPYIENTLIPYLKETYEQGSGDDDFYDYLPSLRDEALELIYNILPEEEANKYFELIDQIIPDAE